MSPSIDTLLRRVRRISQDPERLVDYLRLPRKLVRGTPLMNRLGLQAARALKEQVSWRLRPNEVPAHLRDHHEALDRDGFAVIEDFLPAAAFAELEAELSTAEAAPDRHQRLYFGENYESRLFMISKHAEEFPAFARHLRDNATIYDLARCVARRRATYRPRVMVQWVYKPKPNEPCVDHEYNSYLHVDRHYPFLKAFFYLRDVPVGCAPYSFVRGSHAFNWARLRFEYQLGVAQSAARGDRRDTNPEQKERDRAMERLARELCDKLGLEEMPIAAKKNTLIVSNNQGLHRRGEMTIAGERVTANLDYKFFESPAQILFPVLRHIDPQARGSLPPKNGA